MNKFNHKFDMKQARSVISNMTEYNSTQARNIIDKEAKLGKTDYLEHMLKDIHVPRTDIYNLTDYAAIRLSSYGQTEALMNLHDMGIKTKKISERCVEEALKNGHVETANYMKNQERKTIGDFEKLFNEYQNMDETRSAVKRFYAFHDTREYYDEQNEEIKLKPKTKKEQKEQNAPVSNHKKPEIRSSHSNVTINNNNGIIMGKGSVHGRIFQNGVEKDVEDFDIKTNNGTIVGISVFDKLDGVSFFDASSPKDVVEKMIADAKNECNDFAHTRGTDKNKDIVISGDMRGVIFGDDVSIEGVKMEDGKMVINNVVINNGPER